MGRNAVSFKRDAGKPFAISLAVLVVLSSIVGCLALLRVYLTETSLQFADSFYSQNYPEIEAGQLPEISHRLSRLGTPVNWECIVARYNGQEFFERNPTACVESIFRHVLSVRGQGNVKIEITFAIRLPKYMEHFALFFVCVQSTIFALLFLTGRSFERLSTEAALRLSELASKVAHDIRSPVGVLQIALRAEGDWSEKKELIESAIGRIRKISEDLLSVRRAQFQCDGSSEKETLNSNISVASVVAMLLREKRLEFSHRPELTFELCATPEAATVGLPVERGAFERTLSNILNNAAEAIPKAGTVVVAIGVNVGELEISVRDNGLGIPKDRLAQLGNTSFSNKRGGNGLGASSAAEQIKSWNGRIKWESDERGTSVSIWLPRGSGTVF